MIQLTYDADGLPILPTDEALLSYAANKPATRLDKFTQLRSTVPAVKARRNMRISEYVTTNLSPRARLFVVGLCLVCAPIVLANNINAENARVKAAEVESARIGEDRIRTHVSKMLHGEALSQSYYFDEPYKQETIRHATDTGVEYVGVTRPAGIGYRAHSVRIAVFLDSTGKVSKATYFNDLYAGMRGELTTLDVTTQVQAYYVSSMGDR
jgi:hypothetical protein